jgi:hypothetical protein
MNYTEVDYLFDNSQQYKKFKNEYTLWLQCYNQLLYKFDLFKLGTTLISRANIIIPCSHSLKWERENHGVYWVVTSKAIS